MRKSNNPSLVFDDNGLFVGINFHYGWCAEHEWGIPGIEKYFLNPSLKGCEKRRLSNFNENVWKYYVESKKRKCILHFHSSYSNVNRKSNNYISLKENVGKCYRLHENENTKISTAWGENGFCVFVSGKENVLHMNDLWQAIQKKDAMCYTGMLSKNPFERPHLVLGIISRIPEDVKELILKADETIL